VRRRLQQQGQGQGRPGEGAAAVDFLLALALCNTVVPTATEDGTLLYQVRFLHVLCEGGPVCIQPPTVRPVIDARHLYMYHKAMIS
jgi:hypothetical protein